MSFLQRLGSILVKGLSLVQTVVPIAGAFIPTGSAGGKIVAEISNDLPAIAGIITSVEAMGQALNIKGPDKLKAASPLVAQIVLQSSLLVNHKINDPVLFQKGCESLASGVADILNSLEAKIEVEDKTK